MKRTIKKVFVPHKQLNPRPLFWHPISITFLILVLIFLSSFVAIEKVENTNPNSLLGDIRTGLVVSLTNKERQNVNLPVLTENDLLMKAAKLKAEDMAKREYFSHYSPTGESPWFWFEKAGYEYSKAGENLAVNFDNSKDVVNAWMNSPSHKENIIKDGYTQIGVATAEGFYKGKRATFVVQLFASPKKDTRQFALAIEKKAPVGKNISVQGSEITLFSWNNLAPIFSSKTNIIIISLALILIVVFFAIVTFLFKIKHVGKKSWILLIVLGLIFLVSFYIEFNYLKDFSIHII